MSALKIYCNTKPNYFYFETKIKQHLFRAKNNWVSILPVNRAVRLLTRRLIDEAPEKIISSVPVYTFESFLLKLYKHIYPEKTVISDDLLLFIIEEILRQQSNHFSFFPQSNKPTNNLVRKIADIVKELRRFGYTALELKSKSAEEIALEDNKFHDIIFIFEKLEDRLNDRFIDVQSAVHQTAQLFNKQMLSDSGIDLEHVYVSGYGLFTPAMFTFLESCSCFCDVHVKLEFDSKNELLFEQTLPAFNRFQQMNAEIIHEKDDSFLKNFLFNRGKKTEEVLPKQNFYLTTADNRIDEVTRIAREIRKLHIEKSIPLEKIAVTFSNPEKYVAYIRKTFAEYGVPFNLSTGFALNTSGLVQNFVKLLEFIKNKFDHKILINLFQSQFLANSVQIPFSGLFRELINNRVANLHQNWENKFLHRAKKSRFKFTEQLDQQIDKLKIFLRPFYDFPDKPLNILEFKQAYITLLEDSGALQWYKSLPDNLNTFEREKEFRAFNAFMKLFEQFSWSMQMVYSDQRFELSDWLERFRSALSRATYNVTEWPVKAVQIMPRLEIQAVDYDILFLGGMVDGDFPRQMNNDIFISDDSRERMGLIATKDLLAQDRFMFFNLLAAARQKVYLSYPKYEGEKSLVHSTFVDDLTDSGINLSQTDENYTEVTVEQSWLELGKALRGKNMQSVGEYAALLPDNQMLPEISKRLYAGYERQRINSKPGLFEGNLTSQPKLQEKIRSRFKDHKWSITKLEEYAFCPMQFFMKRILYLQEWPELVEEINPLERGEILHQILFSFYNLLKEQKQNAYPLKNLDLLLKIASDELNAQPFEGFFWELEKIKYFGYENYPGLLELFANYEQETIDETGFVPEHFEFCFGPAYDRETDKNSREDPLILRDNGNSIKVIGKIDRVDINASERNALVLDYKTGSIIGKNVNNVLRGTSFQLPLYILAAEQLLPGKNNVVCGGYFQVKDVDNCKRHLAIADRERFAHKWTGFYSAALPNGSVKIDDQKVTFNEIIELSKKRAVSCQQHLFQGILVHTRFPEDKMCQSFCDYRRMCQKHVSKLKQRAKEQIQNH